jgi:hypothetical protein
MKKLLVTLLFATVSIPGHAWGPYEQGLVAGAAGLWLIDKLSRPQAPIVTSPYGVNNSVIPGSSVYNTPMFKQFYNCLVPVYDQRTGQTRNEVMVCSN